MLNLSSLIAPERVKARSSAKHYKGALEGLSLRLTPNVSPQLRGDIFSGMLQRENLGSTALGNGAAMPHTHLSDVTTTSLAIMTLAEPITYSDEPVDIIVGILLPDTIEQGHFTLLKQLKSLLLNEKFCDALRAAEDSKSLYNTILNVSEFNLSSAETS
jgi:PTS system nitrogen regulatory IIA component